MKNIFKNILFALIACIIIFLFLEGISYIGLQFIKDNKTDSENKKLIVEDDWYIYTPELGWEFKPNYSGLITGKMRSFDSDGGLESDSIQRHDKSREKILFLGDSITYGYGIDTEYTFVEVIDNMIPDINAINLGVPGYSSYQGYKMLLKHGIKMKPDIIVVAFNYNDRRYVLFPANIDSDKKFQAIVRQNMYDRINRSLKRFALYRLMHAILSGSSENTAYREIEWTGKIDMDTIFPRVSKESYRKNLENIADTASENGIRVIFMLLYDNPEFVDKIRKGREMLRSAKYDEAVNMLKPEVRPDNKFSALARVYLARALIGKGLNEEAQSIYILDDAYHSASGGTPISLDDEYNSIMEDVARSRNIPVFDTADILKHNAGLYLDFCHFNTEGHRLIARELSVLLVKALQGE